MFDNGLRHGIFDVSSDQVWDDGLAMVDFEMMKTLAAAFTLFVIFLVIFKGM